MKRSLLILALLISACGGDDSTSPAGKISLTAPVLEVPVTETPVSEVPTLEPVTTTTTTLLSNSTPLTASALTGQSFTGPNRGVSFTATEIMDSRCGGRYVIDSASEAAGVVTITAHVITESLVYPDYVDCMAPLTAGWWYPSRNCDRRTAMPAAFAADQITYRIVRVSGGIAIVRDLTTRVFEMSCGLSTRHFQIGTTSMAEENYYE